MKTITLFIAVIGMLFASNVRASETVVQLVPEKSTFGWVGKKVTGQHNGVIDIASGQVMVAGDSVTGGTFVVDMTTITDLDLENDKDRAKLEGHLKSADFFEVETYPTATFVISSVTSLASEEQDANYSVTGDLTIKGITHSITFPASIQETETGYSATADFTIDRSRWNVKYGSGSFFKGLGDKLIYDDFEVSLDLVFDETE
jgi:polyisoprenoid-binding protein YceI